MAADNAPISEIPLDSIAAARFWANVHRGNGCWNWTGHTKRGYGKMRAGGRSWASHRVSYQIHFGPIPEGLYVLHKCDNPSCVNPAHLEAGTQSENIAQAKRRGRMKPLGGLPDTAAGESAPSSKLTWDQAREIRSRKGEKSRAAIALEYGVSKWCVGDIWLGNTWKEEN